MIIKSGCNQNTDNCGQINSAEEKATAATSTQPWAKALQVTGNACVSICNSKVHCEPPERLQCCVEQTHFDSFIIGHPLSFQLQCIDLHPVH